jgi:uncharacterized protein (TIGR03437 family)
MRFLAAVLLATAALCAQNPPPHPAWAGDTVHEIRLRFTQPDYWQQLTANYEGPTGDPDYLEASLEWGPYKFASVGVRFKGNSSYRGAQTRKKPFRIKTNEFVKGQKIEGTGAFNLSNFWNDPSMVREPAYYDLSAALGLKTPRTNYARLYINDEYIGLYLLGEVINDDFLENHFGKGEHKGNLYKANIGAVFTYLGEDKAAYKQVWEKQTNEDADDWSDLIELCRIIGQTPAAELRAKLEPLMDIDSFLAAIALDNATVNLDSYVGMGQNFNVYRRPSDGKWVWLVWDPSLAFGAFGQGAQNPVQLATEYIQASGLGAPGGGPSGNAGRPLATKLWEIPEYKERYRQIYQHLITRVFDGSRTLGRMNELRAMIRPHVEAETQRLATMAQFNAAMEGTGTAPPPGPGFPGGPGGRITALQPLIEGRLAWLKEQFATQSYPAAQVTASTANLDLAAGNPTQRVELQYTGVNTPPTFSLAVKTAAGKWLRSSVTGGGLPGSFTVTADATGLAEGVHAGSITVFLGGAPNVEIPVTLTVGTLPAPVIGGIANAASYSTGPLAPGQLATLFGTNMGPSSLATNAAGTRVTFDGSSAQLLYTSAGQIGVVVPLAVAGKAETQIQVSYGNQRSAVLTRPVAPTAPGLFTLNASGSGAAAVVNQAGTINGPSASAPRGSIIAIYLTGGGMTDTAGKIAVETAVAIGGEPAEVLYAGAAPGAVQGLYQINAKVPNGAASGAQSVVVTIGGVTSQSGATVQVE